MNLHPRTRTDKGHFEVSRLESWGTKRIRLHVWVMNFFDNSGDSTLIYKRPARYKYRYTYTYMYERSCICT